MPYAAIEKSFENLTDEQKTIVYNLVVSLGRMNKRHETLPPGKRVFGKYAGKASATFADDWEMSEEDLCSL